jgi:Rrf2 family iron-sulfur cluster assembly transcriptional regulator
MRLNTKGRCAVMALIDVALRGKSGPVPLVDIASRQRVSLSYLEQLFSKLRLRGLVTSVRGPGGGYSLGRRVDGITVADILCAVDDEPPNAKPHHPSFVQDITQDLWDAMNAKLLRFTESITLGSLVVDQLATGSKIDQMPPSNKGVFKRPEQPCVRPNVPNSVFALGRASRSNGAIETGQSSRVNRSISTGFLIGE